MSFLYAARVKPPYAPGIYVAIGRASLSVFWCYAKENGVSHRPIRHSLAFSVHPWDVVLRWQEVSDERGL